MANSDWRIKNENNNVERDKKSELKLLWSIKFFDFNPRSFGGMNRRPSAVIRIIATTKQAIKCMYKIIELVLHPR